MPAGIKLSFCSLLWKAHGGQFDEKGRPADPNRKGRLVVITDQDLEEPAGSDGTKVTHRFVRGMCEADYDCDRCEYMQRELALHPPEEVNWLCAVCAASILRAAKKAGARNIVAPGHYCEGACTNPQCERPPRMEEAEGLPGVATGQLIELPQGFSRLLQLVIGPIHNL